MNILITGCNGFVGSALMNYLSNLSNLNVTGLSRDKDYISESSSRVLYINDLETFDKQSSILNSTDVFIHTAGKAHAMDKKGSDNSKDYFSINTDLTTELAKKAASCGVKKFIYLSSTKVFGNPEPPFVCFNAETPTKPEDPYGKSKLKAELNLMEVSKDTGLDVVIIRPPIIYGPGVKGNMRMLLKLVNSNFPLPFRSISENKRSMISLDNLVHFIYHCIINHSASGQKFLVSDDHDLSTYEIIALFKKNLGSKTLIFTLPKNILYLIGCITGTRNEIRRLVETSTVDIEHTKETLKWRPQQSVEQAFEKMIK
jgi:UDP-glucose 4-epimerase